MKYISLLFASIIIVQSISGLPIDGRNGWGDLLGLYNPQYVEGSDPIPYENLCIIEKELENINLNIGSKDFNTDVQVLIYLSDNLYPLLGLSEKEFRSFSVLDLLNIKNELLDLVKIKKHNCTRIPRKKVYSGINLTKYVVAPTLMALAVYTIIKNQEQLKELASEFASQVKSSVFASQVKEVGKHVSTSFDLACQKSRELYRGAQWQAATQLNNLVNSQTYAQGSKILADLGKKIEILPNINNSEFLII